MHLSPPLCQRCRRWVAERGTHCRLCAGSLQLLQLQSRDSFTLQDYHDSVLRISQLVGDLIVRAGPNLEFPIVGTGSPSQEATISPFPGGAAFSATPAFKEAGSPAAPSVSASEGEEVGRDQPEKSGEARDEEGFSGRGSKQQVDSPPPYRSSRRSSDHRSLPSSPDRARRRRREREQSSGLSSREGSIDRFSRRRKRAPKEKQQADTKEPAKASLPPHNQNRTGGRDTPWKPSLRTRQHFSPNHREEKRSPEPVAFEDHRPPLERRRTLEDSGRKANSTEKRRKKNKGVKRAAWWQAKLESKGKGKGKVEEAEVEARESPKGKEVEEDAPDPNQGLDISRTPDQSAADVALRERERSWADASEAPEN